MNHFLRAIFILSWLFFLSPAWAGDISALIAARLQIAEAVAQAKYNSGAAVDDPAREAQILQAMGEQAVQFKLAPDTVRQFFRTQIEAGKMIQRALLDKWRRENHPKFVNAADLVARIRPELDQINRQLLQALADQPGASQKAPASDLPEFEKAWQVAVTGLSQPHTAE